MRWSITSAVDAVALTALALAPLPARAELDCSQIVVDDHKFDLAELKGPHSIATVEFHSPTYTNTTYTLDFCAPLQHSDDKDKQDLQCPSGTRICALKRLWWPAKDGGDIIQSRIPIAGDLSGHGGKSFDYNLTRLRTSAAKADADKEGLRIVLKGGAFEEREQRAEIEFICDRTQTGKDGEWDPSKKLAQEARSSVDARDGSGDGSNPESWPEKQLKNEKAALIWDSYGTDLMYAKADVLKLTWYTKYACESAADSEKPAVPSARLGFLTWMFMIVFLGTASYLIFGSWLNYNRYGARGWDLLPHGDTLRDIPYLFKDWMRRLLNTVQGSGSRGGYSAV